MCIKMSSVPFRRNLITLLLSILLVNQSGTDSEDIETLQEGRTRRMIWLDKKRRLVLPPDTSVSVTPVLAFPMFKQSSSWVTFENLQIQWTFFILFQGLGWTSDDSAWPIDLSLLFPNSSSTPENEGENDNNRRRSGLASCHPNIANKFSKYHLHHCKKMNNNQIPVMALPANSPGGERATLLPRMEVFLNSFGINGRACLQRVVCEIHEIPLKYGFGLLGELITMLFSVSHSTYAKSHLQGYLKAEEAGKFGDCSKFNRKCPYSLFTSK